MSKYLFLYLKKHEEEGCEFHGFLKEADRLRKIIKNN
jgi:hypothetical protein